MAEWVSDIEKALKDGGFECDVEAGAAERILVERECVVRLIDFDEIGYGELKSRLFTFQDCIDLGAHESLEAFVRTLKKTYILSRKEQPFELLAKSYRQIGSLDSEPIYRFTDDFAIFESDLKDYFADQRRYCTKLSICLVKRFEF